MGWFSGMKARRELDALGRAYRDQPSPAAALTHAEACRGAGRLDLAAEALRLGLQRFPRATSLRERLRAVLKQEGAEGLAQLKRAVAEQPTPAAYGELIRRYLALDELERARDACREAIRRFPQAAEPHLELGKLRLARWRQGWAALDGRAAIAAFKRASTADRSLAEPLRLLAELYLECGAREAAQRELVALQRLAPTDPIVGWLNDQLALIPEGGGDPERLLGAVERKGKPALQLPAEPGAEPLGALQIELEPLTRCLSALAGLPGFLAGAAYDAQGQPLTEQRAADGSDPLAGGAELLQIARDAARAMDIGRVGRCELRSPGRSLFFCDTPELSLTLAFDGAPAAKAIWKHVDEGVGAALVAGGGA